jgi:hypothetical protein
MTDDPGLVKLAHDVAPIMLSLFARDRSSMSKVAAIFDAFSASLSRPQASGDGGQPWNTMQECDSQ